MIIGITGTSGAGKDTLAEHFVSKGFCHLSLSDLIRGELQKRGLEINVYNLREVGNELRENEGLEVLAKRAIAQMDKTKNYVITSIRNPFEAKELKQLENFILFSVDAPIEMRYARVLARLGRDDKITKTLAEFKANEELEMASKDKTHQQVRSCMEMADFQIFNAGDREAYFAQADEFLKNFVPSKN
jgi:dephospho-CoA kinase